MPTISPQTTPYYGGGQVVNPANVLKKTGSPGTKLTQDHLGTLSVDNVNAAIYALVSKSGGVDTWINLGGGAGTFTSLSVAGNITATGTGHGLFVPVTTASGASPQTANGRVGSVTFSSVSIAAAATQAFTIANSSIAGSSTVLSLSMVGATTGAALVIQSVANTAGQSVITVANGTGATTTTANITFTYLVLN